MEVLILFLNDFLIGVGSVGVDVCSHTIGLEDWGTCSGCVGAWVVAGIDTEGVDTGGCRKKSCAQGFCCAACCCDW
jgi:hypothetical protein